MIRDDIERESAAGRKKERGPVLMLSVEGDVVIPCYTQGADRASGPCLFYSTHFASAAPDSVRPGDSYMQACIGPFEIFLQEPLGGIPHRDVAGRNLSVVMARVVNPGHGTPVWAACSYVTTYLLFRKTGPRDVLTWEEQQWRFRPTQGETRASEFFAARAEECAREAGPTLSVSDAQDAAVPPYTREIYRTSGPCLFYTTQCNDVEEAPSSSRMWAALGPFSTFTQEPEGGIPYSAIMCKGLSVVLARALHPKETGAHWVPCSQVTTYVDFSRTDRRILHWDEQIGPRRAAGGAG